MRDPDDEPKFEGEIDCSFENNSLVTLDQMKILILEEVNIQKTKNQEPLINVN